MNVTLLKDVLIAFTRATLLGYGGGPSTIPLYEIEVVQRYQWMTKEEFGQTLAFGNALPGPIATKMGAYIGYQVAGMPGAAVALAGTVIPTAVLMVALYSVLLQFRQHPLVNGAIRGLQAALFVMLAMMAADFFTHAFGKGASAFAIAAAYFIAVQFFAISPIWCILGSMAAGSVLLR